MEYAYNVYEDSYNIAVNQWLDRKAIGSKFSCIVKIISGKKVLWESPEGIGGSNV